jgi:hypothetical protein
LMVTKTSSLHAITSEKTSIVKIVKIITFVIFFNIRLSVLLFSRK